MSVSLLPFSVCAMVGKGVESTSLDYEPFASRDHASLMFHAPSIQQYDLSLVI